MDDRKGFERLLHEEICALQDRLRAIDPGFGILGVHLVVGDGSVGWKGPTEEPTRADLELVTGAAATIGRALGLTVRITASEAHFAASDERH